MKWASFLRFLGISSSSGETYPDGNYLGSLNNKEVTVYNTSQPTYRLVYDHHVEGVRLLNLQAIKKNKRHINAIMVLSKAQGDDEYKILIKPGDRPASLKNRTQKLLCVVKNDYRIKACNATDSPSTYTLDWSIKPFINGYKIKDSATKSCLVRDTDNGILKIESCSTSTPEQRFDMLEVADDPYKSLYLGPGQLLSYEMQSAGDGGSLPSWMVNGLAGGGEHSSPGHNGNSGNMNDRHHGYGEDGNPYQENNWNNTQGPGYWNNSRQPWNGPNRWQNGPPGPNNQPWMGGGDGMNHNGNNWNNNGSNGMNHNGNSWNNGMNHNKPNWNNNGMNHNGNNWSNENNWGKGMNHNGNNWSNGNNNNRNNWSNENNWGNGMNHNGNNNNGIGLPNGLMSSNRNHIINLQDLGNNIVRLKDIVKTLKSFCTETFSDFGICAQSNEMSNMNQEQLQDLVRKHMSPAQAKRLMKDYRSNRPDDSRRYSHSKYTEHSKSYNDPYEERRFSQSPHKRHPSSRYRHGYHSEYRDPPYEPSDRYRRTRTRRHSIPNHRGRRISPPLKCYSLDDPECREYFYKKKYEIDEDSDYHRSIKDPAYDAYRPHRAIYPISRSRRHKIHEYE